MSWFRLSGDARLGRCATEGCAGQPTWRLEAGGVGSNYCPACKAGVNEAGGMWNVDSLPPAPSTWKWRTR